jgi:DNA-binding response OmpR family regulator
MKILVSDDDRAFAEYLAALVTVCGHEVAATVTGGGLATMQAYQELRPDLVLLDVMMPKFNGFTVCQQMISRDPEARVILMSGLVQSDYPSVATCGAVGYLHKPIILDELRATLDREEALRRLAAA